LCRRERRQWSTCRCLLWKSQIFCWTSCSAVSKANTSPDNSIKHRTSSVFHKRTFCHQRHKRHPLEPGLTLNASQADPSTALSTAPLKRMSHGSSLSMISPLESIASSDVMTRALALRSKYLTLVSVQKLLRHLFFTVTTSNTYPRGSKASRLRFSPDARTNLTRYNRNHFTASTCQQNQCNNQSAASAWVAQTI
jgi:hypothetical protein